MGNLAELVLPTADVEVPGAGSFSVRGLALDDAAALFREHAQVLETVYEEIKEEDTLDMRVISEMLLRTAPECAAEIIALAGDALDRIDIARKLPLPVQLTALVDIAQLTFHSEEDVKKTLELVIQSSTVIRSLVQRLTAPEPSKIGSGEKESK